jgi:putative tryptophan/tyrosine transport system substrate-binding protein
MRRREFMAGLAGAAVATHIARAQQAERVRRVGVLMGWSGSDPENRSWFDAFVQGMAQFGWADGHNLRIEQRWSNADIDRARAFAKELVELNPDVILSGSTPATAALHQETATIPIVFAVVGDPVGAGFVTSLPRPGGNITGFLNIEATMGGKWLQMLKEIAPDIRRAALLFNPDTAPGSGTFYLGSFEAAARSLAVEPVAVRVHTEAEIETAIGALGREQAGVVISDSFFSVHRRTLISSAARNNVPVIMDIAIFPKKGGLISYGPSFSDLFRRAATYVDRILSGANPTDLPVEVPTKYEFVINLKTAKALGLTIPETLLATADEVIQ